MNENETKLPEEEVVAPAEAVAVETETVVEPEANGEMPRIHEMDKQQLVDTLKEILAEDRMNAHREVTAIKTAFYALRNRETTAELMAFIDEGGAPEAYVATPCALEEEAKVLIAQFKERRNAYLEAEEKLRRENLEKKQAIVAELERLAGDIDNINNHYPAFRKLQDEFREKAELPQGADADVWKSFQKAVETFYDQLKMHKELRDLDYKKNLEVKKQLIEEAKALETAEDPIEAVAKLQNLHIQWRETGPVPKEVRESIWEEFKTSSSVINKRHQEVFAKRKEAEEAAQAAKEAIIAKLEEIVSREFNSFDSFESATKEVLGLQAEWKETGYAPKKTSAKLFSTYRELCDRFFTGKNQYYKSVKAEKTENYDKKLRLCERAEALVELEDTAEALKQVKMLQEEWKTVGSVNRKVSEEVWKRFNTACTAVFERRRAAMSEVRKEENANLVAKREIIESLKALPADVDPRENLPLVRELQNKWNSIGFVPRKVMDELRAEYRTLCDNFYNSLGERGSRVRMEKFERQVSKIKGDERQVGSERQRLVRQLDQKRNELKTMENNLGFFNFKTSGSNSMLKDIERRQQRVKEEIAELEKKIALLAKD